ncbi:hypothetical protein [Mycolicibacterium fortuitum]|nr:hypothetical protein [Mycolicibacterium fortuitum]MCA4722615.1 hypothetical protein [Mycolicibacterium fortuitum]
MTRRRDETWPTHREKRRLKRRARVRRKPIRSHNEPAEPPKLNLKLVTQ